LTTDETQAHHLLQITNSQLPTQRLLPAETGTVHHSLPFHSLGRVEIIIVWLQDNLSALPCSSSLSSEDHTSNWPVHSFSSLAFLFISAI
jgi:hypothetical protein